MSEPKRRRRRGGSVKKQTVVPVTPGQRLTMRRIVDENGVLVADVVRAPLRVYVRERNNP